MTMSLICNHFLFISYPNHRSIYHRVLRGPNAIFADRFNCSYHTFPCYFSSNLICMKI